jgi:short subunit dehydrogenase-like uncharacterized protein
VSPKIVLFGATGYTGRLVAHELAAAGARPLLVGRRADRLAAQAAELGGLDTATADAGGPGPVRALLDEGDVLVSTVGPFLTHGRAAVEAAIGAGATYLDSTGEPPFVRRVFGEYGPRASGRCALLTAFGYDYVPGNLAGALALAGAGPEASRVDVGYFVTGRSGPDAISTGTLASAAGVLLEPGFAWRGGRLVDERSARTVHSFSVDGRPRSGVSVGGSEHLALPRLHAGLRDVTVALGWFGPASRLVQAASAANALAGRLPGADRVVRAATRPLAARTGGGPGPAARRRSGSLVAAVAADARGERLARVTLRGPNPYDLTARLLAWAARRALDGGVTGTGALGPVDAFGLDALRAGCEQAGLVRDPAATTAKSRP